MTHEYVIAVDGLVVGSTSEDQPTAIAWAADHVLAVGSDGVVSAISRGDSTFLEMAGAVVTALPSDPTLADTTMRAARVAGTGIAASLVDAGLLPEGPALEPGSRADLAFWGQGPDGPPGDLGPWQLLAIVRAGAFTEGDVRRGPFGPPTTRPDPGRGLS